MATPSSIDLTTVAAVSAYIGGVDPQDTPLTDLLQSLISAASSYASDYCGRDFRQGTYTQTFNGTGGQRIQLRTAPVTAVSAVVVDNVSVPARGQSAYGFVFDDSGIVYVNGCYAFCQGWQNVSVTFTAGWVTPGQALTQSPAPTVTLPQDIQQAVIETVAMKYKAQRSNIGIAARQIAGETISYVQTDLPKSAIPVFGIYQRVAMMS